MYNPDILVNIFHYLDFDDIYNLCKADPKYQKMYADDQIWSKYFQEDLELVAMEMIGEKKVHDAYLLSQLSPTFKDFFANDEIWLESIGDLISQEVSVDRLIMISYLLPAFHTSEYWRQILSDLVADPEESSFSRLLGSYITEYLRHDRPTLEELMETVPIFQRVDRDFFEILLEDEFDQEESEPSGRLSRESWNRIEDVKDYFFNQIYYPLDDDQENLKRFLDWLGLNLPQQPQELKGYVFEGEEKKIYLCSDFSSFIYTLYTDQPTVFKKLRQVDNNIEFKESMIDLYTALINGGKDLDCHLEILPLVIGY